MELTQLEQGLLDNYQHYFPLTDRPFDSIARHLGIREIDVIKQTQVLLERGVISRIGPIFSADSVGVNRLVIMSVPVEALEHIVSKICEFDEVTHCYEREHKYNLWFVVSTDSDKALQLTLSIIEEKVHYQLVSLPMLHDYQIDLGSRLNFDLAFEKTVKNVVSLKTARMARFCHQSTTEIEQKVIQLIQSGLPVCKYPYEDLGRSLEMSGRELTGVIRLMHHHSVLSRWGVVFRYYELGLQSSAMVVWDVPDDQLDEVAGNIAGVSAVSMCFKRPRCLPGWHFNLFSEVHGKTAFAVVQAVEAMVKRFGLQTVDHSVLFSGRRFKHPKVKHRVVNRSLMLAIGGARNKSKQ